ncbi:MULTISPECIES: chemotaxis protein [Vibrio]|uniref:chemotaxis protein n=1 Tax=Vibrio TaxID=662 RepID=UPI002075817A|nr:MULTISPECIES: chemotaxis protein [Vibrio]USD31270.1 chemotaxis protein [Vibrio sp. SCSIO 43186]USD44316.1 chemotaxis protein [Vibrio sp. SCSIO 43145]USD68393.1 chemotaxis protein [Vibrio sp. SCSIO 43139]USD96079.1 chemotaxis protein [Vibrio coralliilyticus]
MSYILLLITEAIEYISAELIIVTITVMFSYFILASISTVRRTSATLSSLRKIAALHSNGKIEQSKLTPQQQSWVARHLVINSSRDGYYELEMRGAAIAAKHAISTLAPATDLNKYKPIPAILTSLGITGTFIGITVGLSGFSMVGDSTELLTTAMKLLEGMNTAFYTSLVGLMSSAIFMIWMKVCAHQVAGNLNKFNKHLSKHYVEVSAVDYLKNLSGESQNEVIDAQRRSALAMEALGDNMSQIMVELQSLVKGFNSSEVADAVSGAVSQSIEHQLTPVMHEIRSELAQLKEIKEQNQKELVQELINEMKLELITPVVSELEKTSEALTTSNHVSEELNKNVEKVITSTAETVNTINGFQEETMVKLQAFAESLKEILASFKDDTQGAMTTIAIEVKSMLDGASAGLTQQKEAFELSAQKAATSFEGIKSSMELALDERQDKEAALFDGVEQRIDNLINGSSEAFKAQTDVLESVGQQASTLMTSAKEELEAGLGDIDTKVKSMSTTVQAELEAFRQQYQENLSAYFEKQNELLESNLGKQRDGLNSVVDNFRTVFEQEYQTRHNLLAKLTVQHEHLQKSAETIEKVAEAVGLNSTSKMAELQDAAHTMSAEIAKLKREYVNASKAFSNVANDMPKAMESYFKRANESFEVFFKDFDDSASKIHNKLSQAAGYLINAQVQRREFEADEVNS